MSLNPLQHFSLRVFLWSLPLFALWWMLIIPILLPSFALPVGFAISQWFEYERVELKLTPEGEWNVHTKILLKKQPENAKNPFVLSVQLNSVFVFTIGLPLLWALLIAVPGTLRQKFWSLLLGSALFVPFIIFSLWLEVFRHIAQLTTGDNVGEILIAKDLYQVVHPYSTEIISLVTMLVKLSVYMNFMIVPLLITYILHKSFIHAILLTHLTVNQNGKSLIAP